MNESDLCWVARFISCYYILSKSLFYCRWPQLWKFWRIAICLFIIFWQLLRIMKSKLEWSEENKNILIKKLNCFAFVIWHRKLWKLFLNWRIFMLTKDSFKLLLKKHFSLSGWHKKKATKLCSKSLWHINKLMVTRKNSGITEFAQQLLRLCQQINRFKLKIKKASRKFHQSDLFFVELETKKAVKLNKIRISSKFLVNSSLLSPAGVSNDYD